MEMCCLFKPGPVPKASDYSQSFLSWLMPKYSVCVCVCVCMRVCVCEYVWVCMICVC